MNTHYALWMYNSQGFFEVFIFHFHELSKPSQREWKKKTWERMRENEREPEWETKK